jgi:hypothetical protein
VKVIFFFPSEDFDVFVAGVAEVFGGTGAGSWFL